MIIKKIITKRILDNSKIDLIDEQQICTLNETQLGNLIDELKSDFMILYNELDVMKKQATEKLKNNTHRPMSEDSIEAKASLSIINHLLNF